MLFTKGDIEKLNIGFRFIDELLVISEHFDSSTFIVSGDNIISSKIICSMLEDNYEPKNEDESNLIQIYKNLKPNEILNPEIRNLQLYFSVGKKGDNVFRCLKEHVSLKDIKIKDFLHFSFIHARKDEDKIIFTLYHVFEKENDIFVRKNRRTCFKICYWRWIGF